MVDTEETSLEADNKGGGKEVDGDKGSKDDKSGDGGLLDGNGDNTKCALHNNLLQNIRRHYQTCK